MDTQLGFITKVILLSAGGSLLIKWVGPSLPLTGTSATALGIVLLPTIILAGFLGWRAVNFTRLSTPEN